MHYIKGENNLKLYIILLSVPVNVLVSQRECEPRTFNLLFSQSSYKCQAALGIVPVSKNINVI